MKRTPITDTITYIEPQIHLNSAGCAGMLISSTPKIGIDCNVGPSTEEAFIDTERPDIAMVSHYHVDHWGWVKRAQERCGTQIIVPAGEEPMFGGLDQYVAQSIDEREAALRPLWKQIAQQVGRYEALDRFDTYHPNQIFRSGHTLVECIPAPGHSPSHTCFYLPKEKLLYASDMGIAHMKPWYGHRDCDLKAFVDSALKLRSLEVQMILTSHGGMIKADFVQAWDRCLMHFLNLEHLIRRKMDSGEEKSQIAHGIIPTTRIPGALLHLMPLITMWSQIVVDHHVAVIEEGGLESLFPELRWIKSRD